MTEAAQHSSNIQSDPQIPPAGGAVAEGPAAGGEPSAAAPSRRYRHPYRSAEGRWAPNPNKSKGGAPRGNRNNLHHGLRAQFPLGCLPKGASFIAQTVARLRRTLEAAVFEREGEVSVGALAVIQTACRWERHACLAQQWLRNNPDLPVADKLNFSREVARASEARDKSLKLLGVEPKVSDPKTVIASVYNVPLVEPVDSAPDPADATPGGTEPHQRAPGAHTGDTATVSHPEAASEPMA